MEVRKTVDEREGFVLCSVYASRNGRKVIVGRYATDEETKVGALDRDRVVYPSDAVRGAEQVERLRDAFEDLVAQTL